MEKKSKKTIEGKKLFIVHVNVGNLEDKEVEEYMEKVKLTFTELQSFDDVMVIYMPNRGQGHGVELVYQ